MLSFDKQQFPAKWPSKVVVQNLGGIEFVGLVWHKSYGTAGISYDFF
jgi:hypothetical protein